MSSFSNESAGDDRCLANLFLYEDPAYYAYYTTNNLGLAFSTRINTVNVGKGSMMDYSKCGTVL